MEAWTYSRTGPYRQTLTLSTSHPYPTFPPKPPFPSTAPKPEEWILISVSYAALNPADLVALTSMPFFLHKTTSAVPCLDFTGVVLDVWSPTSSTPIFKKGDQVICTPPLPHLLSTGSGGLQKAIALPAKFCVPLPPSVPSIRDATGLFLTACTADLQVSLSNLRPGQRVLIIGASGGVGTMAVQLARCQIGPSGYIVAVCSGRNRDLVLGLGADEVIDYTQHPGPSLAAHLSQRFGEEEDKRFDNIIDTYGSQPLYTSCSSYLKPSGTYSAASIHYDSYRLWDLFRSVLTIASNTLWPKTPWLGGTGRTWKITSMMGATSEQMTRLSKMLGEGKLKVVIDSEWGWEDVHSALDVLGSGHAAGKVLVRVNGEGF
ncbi:putative quinone-oxidoreductase, chloroplastic [Podospora australis]|uniref:Quinone-oxidoreductase, chloroplastic n=1 Tax=Podospora australis TaxID=1536484 RepID=A0AAN7AMU9_9PEZI|nr:putative quinone-oxidoreductase, chloroplastic [Podospora australis]